MRYFLEDYDLNLYYINEETGELELVYDDIDKNEEGFYQFDLYHNSEYLLANDPVDALVSESAGGAANNGGNADSDKNATDVITGDNSNMWIPVIIGLCALVLAAALVLTRKAHK